MNWLLGVIALLLVAGFVVFGGLGGISAVLIVALLLGVLLLFGRTRRSHP